MPSKQPKRRRLWLGDGSRIRLRPQRRNHVWAYDFVEARTHDGRRLRLLVVIDEYTPASRGSSRLPSPRQHPKKNFNDLSHHDMMFKSSTSPRTTSSSTKCAGLRLRGAVHPGSNTASRYTTRRVRGSTELTTHTRRDGDANLTTGIRMDQPSSLLTNIAARRSCLKTSSEKWSES